MEYLHILPAKLGEISDFLWAMERHCNMDEHRFLVTISKNGMIKGIPGMLAFPYIECVETPKGRVIGKIRKFLWIWKRLHKADCLIWHGLQMANGKYAMFLWVSKKLRQKSVWIPDGPDAVSWKQLGKGWKKKFNNHVQKKVRDEIPVVGAIFGSNVAYLKEKWPDKTVVETPYPLSEEFLQVLEQHREAFEQRWQETTLPEEVFLEEEAAHAAAEEAARLAAEEAAHAAEAEETAEEVTAEEAQEAEGEPAEEAVTEEAVVEEMVEEAAAEEEKAQALEEEEAPVELSRKKNIQIGMNSSLFCKHIPVMSHMKKHYWRRQNIFLPMNYTIRGYSTSAGTKVYQGKVVKEAHKIWAGNRVQQLNKSVTPASYAAYLRQLDVAVLGSDYVLDAPYFLYLLWAKVKLYMPESSKVYQYLQEQGVEVHPVTKIKKQVFSTFTGRTGREGPSEAMAWYYDRAQVMERWNALFDYLRQTK